MIWSTRLWTRRRPHWALTALPKTMYGLWPISMRIRSTMMIFPQRKGKKGYDERQVDYFLNACVQLLSRLGIPMHLWPISCPASPRLLPPTATNVTVQANGVSPLFASGTQRPATDERFAPSAVAHDRSFDAPASGRAKLVHGSGSGCSRNAGRGGAMRRLLHRSMLPQAPIAPMRNSRFPLLRSIPGACVQRVCGEAPSRTPSVAPTAAAAGASVSARPRRFPV